MGLGAFPGSDPLFSDDRNARYLCGNMSTGACDLLLAVGVRFDDRVTGKTDIFARPGQNRTHRHRPDFIRKT